MTRPLRGGVAQRGADPGRAPPAVQLTFLSHSTDVVTRALPLVTLAAPSDAESERESRGVQPDDASLRRALELLGAADAAFMRVKGSKGGEFEGWEGR